MGQVIPHPYLTELLMLSGPAGSGPHIRKRTDGKDPSSCVSDAPLRNLDLHEHMAAAQGLYTLST